ncbi:hypothetical protein [Rhizobium sp. SGZ-381]|uniref:hypothetical protein n=1 Tax=Rhizobium sp. SGZ-381 TaxID=3342800 RepID=UPI00366B15A0
MATVPLCVLIVLDGEEHPDLPDRELAMSVAAVYLKLKGSDADAVFTCHGGGFPPVACSMRKFSDEGIIGRFLDDYLARSDIADALALEQIVVDDFEAAVFFPTNPPDLGPAAALKQAFLDQGRTVVLPAGWQAEQTTKGKIVVRSSATDLDWLEHLLR